MLSILCSTILQERGVVCQRNDDECREKSQEKTRRDIERPIERDARKRRGRGIL